MRIRSRSIWSSSTRSRRDAEGGDRATGLDELEHLARSVANRLGAAIIIAALLVASALMARVNETVAVVGLALSVALGLFELWRIFRTPGDL